MAISTPSPSRFYFLDNLRTFLTVLVIAHHTAMPYGGIGYWAFHSNCFHSSTTIPSLLHIFNAINQSVFMGLFFWISGRMSALMLSHRSPWVFMRRKIVRLWIPTALYTLLLNPLTEILGKWEDEGEAFGPAFVACLMGVRGVRGPVWYTALLLVFDCVAAALVAVLRRSKRQIALQEHHRRWGRVVYRALSTWGWLVVAAVSFFLRLWYPVGVVAVLLNIQPAYLPQYIFAYILGYISLQLNEERFKGPFDYIQDTSESAAEDDEQSIQQTKETQTSKSTPTSLQRTVPGAVPLRQALSISLLTLPTCIIIPHLLTQRPSNADSQISSSPLGGWNLSALLYAIWNEFSFVTLGPALMAHFQQWHNNHTTSWLWQARFSYAAYLLHPPISVATEAMIDVLFCKGPSRWSPSDIWWWMIVGPVIFTAVISIVNATISFAAARILVIYIPGLRRFI